MMHLVPGQLQRLAAESIFEHLSVYLDLPTDGFPSDGVSTTTILGR